MTEREQAFTPIIYQRSETWRGTASAVPKAASLLWL